MRKIEVTIRFFLTVLRTPINSFPIAKIYFHFRFVCGPRFEEKIDLVGSSGDKRSRNAGSRRTVLARKARPHVSAAVAFFAVRPTHPFAGPFDPVWRGNRIPRH
jgi:hypothetical protein